MIKNTPHAYDYDLFVIGAGSGGVRASNLCAQTGAKVAIAEASALGGTCVNLGCVPKKLMVYASYFSEAFEDSAGYGWKPPKSPFNWNTLIENKNKEIKRLNSVYHSLLTKQGVTIYKGIATLLDPHTLSVNDQTFTAKKILISTGSWPFIPNIPGKEHVVTSNEFFHLSKQPKKALIVGGGYIAAELAGILNGLGTEVTLSYRGEALLRKFDQEIRSIVSEEITKKGVDLQLNSQVESIQKLNEEKIQVTFSDQTKMNVDLILYATGRRPNISSLNLETIGVQLNEKGSISVNDSFQTSVESIYALGDVIGTPELTPVALAQAKAFISTHYLNTPKTLDYTSIPTSVFCQPNIGTVGLTESEAKATYSNIIVYKSHFKSLKHSLTGRDEKTFMKLVVEKETERVLGAHMVGPAAGEIIQGIAIAIKAGATKATFDETIGVHPTLAEEFVSMKSS